MEHPTEPHGFDGFWYRAEVRHYSVADEWGDHAYSTARVEVSQFAVVRETPKCVFLMPTYGNSKDPDEYRGKDQRDFIVDLIRVRGKAIRQHAAPTKELAIRDAICRKERHIAGCKARLAGAEADLQMLTSKLWRSL